MIPHTIQIMIHALIVTIQAMAANTVSLGNVTLLELILSVQTDIFEDLYEK